jgi:hypothetical protein
MIQQPKVSANQSRQTLQGLKLMPSEEEMTSQAFLRITAIRDMDERKEVNSRLHFWHEVRTTNTQPSDQLTKT